MNNFKRINNLTGWVAFAIALVTYTLTVERTASFWDCGEFIACSYKLQVPHPSGAPLFLLIGRLFSLLAFGDVYKVAFWINMLSALASAFTILFMFWTITMLGRKALNKKAEELSQAEVYLLMGAGIVGGLAYTWSDTFWFSAVEAEVYAMSSFFTALVVWAAFKWELIEDEAAANRWLLLIAYIVGVSIGVHLLNLVTIPALALIYYFKKYPKPTYRGGIATIVIGLLILGVINSGVIPGLPSIAGKFEIFSVNTFGLPYGSGVTIFIVLFFAALVYGIIYSQRKNKVVLNLALLALAFVLIGYASYIQVLVRANFNPPINENDPKDALSYVSYLKREQYGDRSLLYGPVFTAQAIDQKKGEPLYRKRNNKYEVYDYRPELVWEADQQMLLPRLSSRQPGHADLYRSLLNLPEGQKPSFAKNLQFMFTYQMGHMYMRYFLWNFVGRESDIQDAGTMLPWQAKDKGAYEMVHSKGRNNFFMLPLILGLIGLFFHVRKQEKDFVVTVLLFLLTGLALVVFLNSPPTEPRERDYIYVGSFYFFTIWIGLGVLGVYDLLSKLVGNATTRAFVATGASLLVPVVMVAQGWDDHDRSNRYHSVDFAKNLLNSCAPNAILFTGGDNDTFPLWYVQEVEGFRTDVRVCNLSLLGTDWYINQMKRKTYESAPLPISLEYDQYINGKNDIIYFIENPNVKDGINLKEYMKLIKEDSPAIRYQSGGGFEVNVLPSSTFFLNIDTEKVKKLGFVGPKMEPLLSDTLSWSFGKNDVYKSDLIQLDIIAQNNWERPVYFSSTLMTSSYLGLKEFMQLEGLAYRLMPFKVPGAKDGFVNADVMYDRLMKNTFWREMNNPNTYYNEFYTGSPVITSRIAFLRLADQLIRENKKDKARDVLNRSLQVMPDTAIPYDQISVGYVESLLQVGETAKALAMSKAIAGRCEQNLEYYLVGGHYDGGREINSALYQLNTIVQALKDNGQANVAKPYETLFTKYYAMADK
ncbi:MAG: DUF2723 domain-containing protein [Spirosomataceae bacterium]